ncbi:MAG: hypothetical protein RR951_00095 [Ruthenibacterium sp.]
MRTWYRLTAWNWYIVRKPWLLVCAVMSVAQTAALLLSAGGKKGAGIPCDSLWIESFACFIFAAGYLAVMAVTLRPVLQAQGKSRGAYTLQTLPAKRGTVLLSQIACTALALCGTIAWQLVLVLVLYWPVTAVSNAAAAKFLLQYTVPHADMQLSFVRNMMVRLLLPTTAFGALLLLLLIVAPSVLLVCAFFHRGAARFWAVCMGLMGAGCCFYLLVMQVAVFAERNSYLWGRSMVAILLLLALMALAVVLALRSIRRAAWL